MLLFPCVVVFVVSLTVALSLLDAPFWGEDELLVLQSAIQANRAIGEGRIDNLIQVFLRDYHPPARTLMAMPFVWLLGPTGVALRLPNCVLWGLVCGLAAGLGFKLGGLRAGWVAGLFLGVSGLFNLFAMGHGHSGEAVFVMAALWRLIDKRRLEIESLEDVRSYCMGGMLLAAGFLYFTSLLPVAALYHALHVVGYLKSARRDPNVARRFISASLIFVAFYGFYYVFFLGLPLFAFGVVSGQLHQNMLRSSAAGLNLQSLQENIFALNWYVFPWLHLPILALGAWEMYRRCVFGFWITLPFCLLFSFYLQGMTGAHFFAYFCWTVPFAASRSFGSSGRANARIRAALGVLFVVAAATWSYFAHIRTYSYESYPESLRRSVHGHSYWPNNRAVPPNKY